MVLSRDQILQADDLTVEIVEVPEWGGEVKVRALTGRERDQLEASVTRTNAKGDMIGMNLDNLRARLCAMALINGDGELLFTTKADILALGGKSGIVLNRVFEVAQRLSGITAEDVDKLTKNSSGDPQEDSPTD